MDEVGPALRRAAEIVAAYRAGLPDARVTPIAGRADVRAALGALPDGPTPLDDVLSELVETATPGLMTSSGPRYFGFVIGGSLDAALVADVITSGWEQNAFNEALSPAGIAFEDVAGDLAQGDPRASRRPRPSGSPRELRVRTRSVWPRAAGTC